MSKDRWQDWEYQKIPQIEDNNFQSQKRFSPFVLRRLLKSRERDVKHCEKCGKKGTKKDRMTVHHKDGNCCNNLPENLEVLCRECHQEEENRKRVHVLFDC